MKLAIAAAGVVAVLLAFGVLTVLKMVAQSMGMLSRANSAPSFDPPPASSTSSAAAPPGTVQARRLQGPSTAITVTLDAGRPPP